MPLTAPLEVSALSMGSDWMIKQELAQRKLLKALLDQLKKEHLSSAEFVAVITEAEMSGQYAEMSRVQRESLSKSSDESLPASEREMYRKTAAHMQLAPDPIREANMLLLQNSGEQLLRLHPTIGLVLAAFNEPF